ncbi:hypothetical protein NE237_011786 [Protea cynaroides]|uniref:Reverse transcriptase zinc-binding domain-containing protein n=1 Tax=Protea cynaroides TaxID=273540 RepID=A0A9Q0GWA5_9MAGN|nr:hypothetical protein NE237_011786 [Protea cynaroides]
MIPVELMCRRCGKEVETIEHVLLYCSFASAAWFGSRYSFLVPQSNNLKFHQWLQSLSFIPLVSKAESRLVFSYAAFMCWRLRMARNNLYFENIDCLPSDVITRVERSWIEFHGALSRPLGKPVMADSFAVSHSTVITTWSLPLTGFIKLNGDAAASDILGTQGLSFILRYSVGSPLRAVS